jgi:hypothetical protein
MADEITYEVFVNEKIQDRGSDKDAAIKLGRRLGRGARSGFIVVNELKNGKTTLIFRCNNGKVG